MKNCTPTLRMMGLLLMLCCSASVFAQNWSYGVRAGFNASDASGLGLFRNPSNVLPAYHIGVFGETYLYNEVRLCPELTYAIKGFRSGGNNISDGFIDLSLVGKLPLGEGISYFIFGPFASYQITKNDLLPDKKPFDIGGIIGYGYQINEQLGAELRVVFPATVWERPASLGGDPYRLAAWSIGLTYLLPWGQ